MTAMTQRIRRVIYIAATAAAVTATVAACGAASAVNSALGAAGAMSQYETKIQAGLTATYKATYADTDGTTTTVEQQPPNSAFISGTSSFLVDGTTSYSCDLSTPPGSCVKTTYDNSSDAAGALALSNFFSGGFMAAGMLLPFMELAALEQGVKVTQSTQTIAGQNSNCVQVTGVPGGGAGATDAPSSFTVCITDSGVVSKYASTDSDGKPDGMTLTSYSSTVDPSLFQPPAGATITDANNPFPSGIPSIPIPSFPGLPSGIPSGLLPSGGIPSIPGEPSASS